MLAVVMLASMMAMAAPAAANHPSSCVDLTPETASNPAGANHTITARLRPVTAQCTQAEVTPTSGPVNIDFEITGVNDVDGGNTPDTPDLTCAVAVNASTCTVTYSGNGTGTDTIRGWIDHDGLTSTQGGQTEADLAETQAGEDSDITDVVSTAWSGPPAAITVLVNHSPDSAGGCATARFRVTDAAGTPVTGATIDVEARHSTATDNTPNNEPLLSFCEPVAAGSFGVDESRGDLRPPAENPDNLGTLGGEVVTDSDGGFWVGIGTDPANGSNGTGTVSVVAFFDTSDNDDRDASEPQAVTTLTFVAPFGRTITCDTESGDPQTGSPRNVDCTVSDRFDFEGLRGISVTFTESGPGEFTTPTTVVTDENGIASVTVTSSQAGAQVVTATITDDLTGNEPGEVDDCDRAENDPADALPGNCSDSITLNWMQEAPHSVTLSPAEAFAPAGGRQTFLVTVRHENGFPMRGIALDWEAVGAGDFVSADAFTNASGQAEAVVTSDARGDVSVVVSTEPCETGGDCEAAAVVHFGPDFCDVYGTEGADRLVGTAGNDVICAFDGRDEVIGGGGNDRILGHGGNDILIGGRGRDTIQAGAGRDFVRGGDGRDFVRGGRGNDVLLGNSGPDFLSGGSEDDDLIGGGGRDTLIGRGGNDRLNGGRGRDGCNGGRGRDPLRKCELRVTVTR
ncbi:MAG: Ig-like domain-containing protein [Actinomycetota bacterium]|nr:Ig-like domain-containing protein [Actinomycetota bacterium]